MDFRILGALEVSAHGAVAELGPPKQRALLAILLLHAGEIVPIDRLIDLLWGENPPRTSRSLDPDLHLGSAEGDRVARRQADPRHSSARIPARRRPRDHRCSAVRAAGGRGHAQASIGRRRMRQEE
jgi:hypothetical protein